MFFDIIGLVSAEKRLINVVNLEKKGIISPVWRRGEWLQFLPHPCEAVRLVRRYSSFSCVCPLPEVRV